MNNSSLQKMSCFSITLFFVTSGLVSVNNVSQVGTLATTLYVGGSGPGNYSTIQSAINAASSGDTVFVYNGIYYENILIYKTINLIGEDKDNTIIDGGGSGNVINSGYTDVTIKEFTLQNGSESAGHSRNCCIEVISNHNTICDTNIKNSYNGIHLFNSDYSTIRNNTVQSCYNGIHLESSKNSIINNNDVFNNELGFYVNHLSDSNIFSENNIFQNSNLGMYVYESNDNEFYHNTFIDNANQVTGYRSSNSWDNGYPSSGNYWDDYTGYDIYSGPNQDILGSDGIGDTPYTIPGDSNQDRYPLGYFQNAQPVPNFTYSPSSPTDLEMVQFTDTSIDYDGTIVGWFWNFGDEGTSTIRNPTHQYVNDGSYLVNLTVTDDDGASDTASQCVVVSNVAPIADADGPYNGTTDYAIQFQGLGSYDPDGTIVSYDWDFGDGDVGSGVEPIHRYEQQGIYNVILTVTDDDGANDTDATLAVINKGEPPMMNLLYPPEDGVINGTITVRWFAYDAIDGDNIPIYIYFRDINDIFFSAFEENPYSNNGTCEWDTTVLPDGTYQLLIEAIDNEGNIGVDRSTFQIKNHKEPPVNNAPLKPNTPSGPISGKKGLYYAYITSTTDPDDDQVYYCWDWGDGTTSGWFGPYNSGGTINTTHMWNISGQYLIKVKAKDIYGKESAWSDPLPITMPYVYNSLQYFFDWLFQRFPHAFPLLRHIMR